MMTTCPYCERPVASFGGRAECPACGRPIFNVPCAHCGRPTLNLTHIPRYGKAACFACAHEVTTAPGVPAPEGPAHVHPRVITALPRAPKMLAVPTAGEARKVIEATLVGLERAAQDREVLRAPDLRAVITRFLDTVQEALALDDDMERGVITAEWLRQGEHLERIIRLCHLPLLPLESVLLPASAQAWMLAVDDALRHWQQARRTWLTESCGLAMMPTVAGISTTNPVWQDIQGAGAVVTEVLWPGFLLYDEVLLKARVRAQE